jgi:hypothetical protein
MIDLYILILIFQHDLNPTREHKLQILSLSQLYTAQSAPLYLPLFIVHT